MRAFFLVLASGVLNSVLRLGGWEGLLSRYGQLILIKLAATLLLGAIGLAHRSWAIAQVPQVAAAFVAIDADTGAYHALVGGFDYNLQKFNHVTQAWRQPGSAIKPFVYSAALDKGYSPGTRILDEPLDIPLPLDERRKPLRVGDDRLLLRPGPSGRATLRRKRVSEN